jgi:superfamily II RNA helicase
MLNVTYRGYTLDPFQVQAITEIEQGHSLVLSAPTGSGKTLVAEFLIERILKTDQRVIYTSPIKALSNQKFRDFSRLYGDRVGILTGDVVINREAQALIMTTEVYRNMAIEDPEAIADVAYLIFDEIHYIGDIERGTVWEESIIFSPPKVRFLALSATIPNCDELARWIESLVDHRVAVISSDHRSVPLSYSFFHAGALVPFKELTKRLSRDGSVPEEGGRRSKKSAGDQRHVDIIRSLRNQDRLPLLYFAFSRALVDEMTETASRKFDFTTPADKKKIEATIQSYFDRYNLESLESANILAGQLMRGVGRHHAGLLPQLKELVEILFAEKLLQVLYVTETFALGVNMPARSVAFDNLKKFDGRSFRLLKTLEFCQISGRAGRRGIDTKGWVIVPFLPRDFNLEELERIIYGDIEPLLSQFDLSFNSVLNLFVGHRDDEIRIILKKNFAQFQANRELPKIANMVADLRRQIEDLFPRCTEKKNDLEAFAAFFRKRQESINALNLQIGQTRKGMRGRKNRFYRDRLQNEFKETMDRLNAEESGFICGQCHNRGACTNRLFKISKIQQKLDHWKGLFDQQGELQLPMFEKKVEILKKLGYIDDKGFLARGDFASRIHIEEIAVTELYFHGLFHEWDHHEINALVVSLVYEFRRRGSEAAKLPRGQTSDRLRRAKALLAELSRKYSFVKPLDISLAAIMHEWSRGKSFDDIMTLTTIPEGDIIRVFRQAIDLLRQIREATPEHSLRDKISDCIGFINRDIILATELRD